MLSKLSIYPTSVLEHSSDEIAAIYTARALSYIFTINIAYYRGLISAACRDRLNIKGAILSVNLSQDFIAFIIVKELGEVIKLAFSKARSRICTRRKTRRKEKNEGRIR